MTGESYPDIDTVPPREAFQLLLGEGALTDLLLYLRAYRGSPTAAEVVTALDHPRGEIADAVERLGRVGAVACPQPGRYQLTANPVARRLCDVIDTTADQTRANRGQEPLAAVVADD